MRKLCLLPLLLKKYLLSVPTFPSRTPLNTGSLLTTFRSPALSPVTAHFPGASCLCLLVSVSFVGFSCLPAFNVSGVCLFVCLFWYFFSILKSAFVRIALAHGSHSSTLPHHRILLRGTRCHHSLHLQGGELAQVTDLRGLRPWLGQYQYLNT